MNGTSESFGFVIVDVNGDVVEWCQEATGLEEVRITLGKLMETVWLAIRPATLLEKCTQRRLRQAEIAAAILENEAALSRVRRQLRADLHEMAAMGAAATAEIEATLVGMSITTLPIEGAAAEVDLQDVARNLAASGPSDIDITGETITAMIAELQWRRNQALGLGPLGPPKRLPYVPPRIVVDKSGDVVDLSPTQRANLMGWQAFATAPFTQSAESRGFVASAPCPVDSSTRDRCIAAVQAVVVSDEWDEGRDLIQRVVAALKEIR